MVDSLSRNPLDTVVEKALMTPKVASSDSVLQLVALTLCKEILESQTIELRDILSLSMILSYIVRSF